MPEVGLAHQSPMPDVPRPEDLESDQQRMQRFANDMSLPLSEKARARLRRMASLPFPMEMRRVAKDRPRARSKVAGSDAAPITAVARQYVWMRTTGRIPADPLFHRCALAYLSDWGFLETSLHPHGVSVRSKNLQIASRDHAIWFHAPFRADDWLLFEMESNAASQGRGLVWGRMYQNGRLVVSVAQEGLIRLRKTPSAKKPSRMVVPEDTSAGKQSEKILSKL